MPGMLLVPAGLGGVAARLEVILEEMLEVRGLPTGRMPSMSCNERVRRGNEMPARRPRPGAGWGRMKWGISPSLVAPCPDRAPPTQHLVERLEVIEPLTPTILHRGREK